MKASYFFSATEGTYSLILDLGKGANAHPFQTIRVREKSCMIYAAVDKVSAMRLLPANSVPSERVLFDEALYVFLEKAKRLMALETSTPTPKQNWMAQTLRFVHSRQLEQLRMNFLASEDFESAVCVRDEINRRVDKGYMIRNEDGFCSALDLPETLDQPEQE